MFDEDRSHHLIPVLGHQKEVVVLLEIVQDPVDLVADELVDLTTQDLAVHIGDELDSIIDFVRSVGSIDQHGVPRSSRPDGPELSGGGGFYPY
jgi:hypothetical protein